MNKDQFKSLNNRHHALLSLQNSFCVCIFCKNLEKTTAWSLFDSLWRSFVLLSFCRSVPHWGVYRPRSVFICTSRGRPGIRDWGFLLRLCVICPIQFNSYICYSDKLPRSQLGEQQNHPGSYSPNEVQNCIDFSKPVWNDYKQWRIWHSKGFVSQ